MASDSPPPEAAPEQPGQPGTARRAWQGHEARGAPESRASGRRTKILVVTAVLALLIASAVVLVRYINPVPTSPHLLAIHFPEHDYRHFPMQLYAKADGDLLTRHFKDARGEATKTKELLVRELKNLKNRPADQPLVIHLEAPALVRGKTIYLLPSDAEPDSDANWLDLEEVLAAVGRCPARDHLLLILDLTQGFVDPRLGVHADRVAEALEARLEKDPPAFRVLCPCSAGETSLTSEILRSSVLAFYLDQGLSGEAGIDNEKDMWVSDLFEFVKKNVDRWAQNNRGLRQQPRLFGRGDFIIAPRAREVQERKAPGDPEPYPDALVAAWKKHDELAKGDAFKRAGRQLRRLEANLLRDETRWRAGAAGKESGRELIDPETRELTTELAKVLATPAPLPRFLSVCGVKENKAAAEAVAKALQRGADRLKGVDEKKAPEEIKKSQAEIAGTLQKDKDATYVQQVWIISEALSSLVEFKQEHVRIIQGVVGGLKSPEPLVEVLYIERLAAFADRKKYPETFLEAKTGELWRAMRARENVLAALAREPEFLFPWVKSSLEQADKDRRAAEKKLLWDLARTWPEALEALKASAKTYDKIGKSLQGMHAASAALDLALAELPKQARILRDGPDADVRAEKLWMQAAEDAIFLQKYFLAAPDMRDFGDAKLDTRARDLQDNLDELMHAYRLRIDAAKNADTPIAQRQMLVLLQTPLLKSVERAELIKKLRLEAKKLHDGTETNQPGLIAAEHPPRPVVAEMSAALLRLSGIEAEPGDEATLHRLWGAEGLVKRWHDAPPDRRGYVMSRLVSPWDRDTKDDHARQWQHNLREAHLEWLRALYVAEGRDSDPRDQTTREFYLDAAP